MFIVCDRFLISSNNLDFFPKLVEIKSLLFNFLNFKFELVELFGLFQL